MTSMQPQPTSFEEAQSYYGDLSTLPQNFQEETRPSMGLEEEHFIVDAKTSEPLPLFEEIRSRLPSELQAPTHREYLKCQIEYAPPPQITVDAIRQVHLEFVREVSKICRLYGAELSPHAILPDWDFDPAMVSNANRSQRNMIRHGLRANRLASCSIHIHVAVSRRAAIHVLDCLQSYVPLLVAISANSPQMPGRVERLWSHRAESYAYGFETSGFLKPFRDWDGFQKHVEVLQKAGIIESQKDMYNFVRPTRYGTIEVRCCDLPADFETAIQITALVQTLAVAVQSRPELQIPFEVLHSDLLSAIDNGPNAKLTNWHGNRVAAVDLITELCESLDQEATGLGTKHELDYLVDGFSHRARQPAISAAVPSIQTNRSTLWPRWVQQTTVLAAGMMIGAVGAGASFIL